MRRWRGHHETCQPCREKLGKIPACEREEKARLMKTQLQADSDQKEDAMSDLADQGSVEGQKVRSGAEN